MRRTTMQELPRQLVDEKILTKIPITSLREVRSTCKLWNDLSKEWILGKAASTRHQFLGFMTMDSKLRSLRFHRVNEDLDDISIKKVDLFNQVEITRAFHCDGLLLCVVKDNSSLVLWNPYLGQTLWIRPRISFHRFDRYALGYDNKKNRNHKILRFVEACDLGLKYDFGYEIYDSSSGSWRAFDLDPEFRIEYHQHGASLKGNTYFFAQEKVRGQRCYTVKEFFILFFDFTSERFGPRLTVPFQCQLEETVALSCVRDEQLAVLYQQGGVDEPVDKFEIWVTTRIEPDAVSWMKFLKLDMRPAVAFDEDHVSLRYDTGTFFIDEEKRIAVVFDTCPELYQTAYIIGDDGYFKSVFLGAATYAVDDADCAQFVMPRFYPALVCSSPYLPSLVQINQPRKRKDGNTSTREDKRTRKDKLSANQPTAHKERKR